MLAVQMVGTHNAVMDCLHRAMHENQNFPGREQALKHASKLSGIFTRQLEALDKHRGKAQQRADFENVNNTDRGQAAVEHIESGRREETAQLCQEQQRLIAYEPGTKVHQNVSEEEAVLAKKKRKAKG